MSTCFEAVEFLREQLHAKRIELSVKECADYRRACHELGGETSVRIERPGRTILEAVGWLGVTIAHTCYSTPDCGAKR